MRARFSVHPSRSLGPVRTPRARELQNALRTQDAKRRAAKPTPIKMPRRSNSFFRGVPPRHLFKASPHNSPRTSWRPICPTNALQNLAIRKVFLRFCAFLQHKFSRRSARVESCGNALNQKRHVVPLCLPLPTGILDLGRRREALVQPFLIGPFHRQ